MENREIPGAPKRPGKGGLARARIIRAAAALFVRDGYYATGIREVIAASETSKGSFYFYFASKKELGAAVLQFYQQKLLSRFRAMAEGHTWPEFSGQLMDFVLSNTDQKINFGCPFAVLGMETAFVEPELSAMSYDAMLESVTIFAEAFLQSGLSQEQAKRRAERAFSCYEGYMLRYRLSGQRAELLHLKEALEEFA